ncbi:hypothetical protein CLOSTHATH_04109 [Hungatella hathewayi DSM 13479]|uniref:Uncharacterized protein n=1 Tax=Hungatella hathewayi DSM 13479 TaxID=566550 RepID=D3AKG6_9FIRM|nr:hypothetical protein CLOSTHATH_04109 [Hungatella hathewayi DSM 13479]
MPSSQKLSTCGGGICCVFIVHGQRCVFAAENNFPCKIGKIIISCYNFL